MSKTVYLIGSGFSKAISDGHMPTLCELGQNCIEEIDQLLESYKISHLEEIKHNPELLLSHLYQRQPWQSFEEIHRELSLFFKVAEIIADNIRQAETLTRKELEVNLTWQLEVIKLWHQEEANLLTLNYDTLVEWLTHKAEIKARTFSPTYGWRDDQTPPENAYYTIPLSSYNLRTSGIFSGDKDVESYKLMKLHGSTNWFHSGSNTFEGEEIYYYSAVKNDPCNPPNAIELVDKVPMIIPPVAEKSTFYGNQSLRHQWVHARNILEEAEEMVIIGYSLPLSDLTIQDLLQTTFALTQKPVTIIDTNKDLMIEKCKQVFPNSKLNDDYLGLENPLKSFVEARLSTNP